VPISERIFIRLSPVSHPGRLPFKVMYVEAGDKRIIKSIVKA